MGPCMCGDPCCPSCGPAQGYCPKCYEAEKDECDCADVCPEDDPNWHEDRERWIADREQDDLDIFADVKELEKTL